MDGRRTFSSNPFLAPLNFLIEGKTSSTVKIRGLSGQVPASTKPQSKKKCAYRIGLRPPVTAAKPGVLCRRSGEPHELHPAGTGREESGGVLTMNVKSVFNIMGTTHLRSRKEALEIVPDHVGWTSSIRGDRQMIMKPSMTEKLGEVSTVETSIPQVSPGAPILLVTYLSGTFDKAESTVPVIRGLTLVDDIGWWANGKGGEALVAKTSEASDACID